MLALGTHPRLAAMLLAPADADERALACDLAALIEARDPCWRARSGAATLAERWQALAAFRHGRVTADASRRRWPRSSRRRSSGAAACASTPRRGDCPRTRWRRAAARVPDRIASSTRPIRCRYQLANGRSARLFDDSALYGEPWMVISELRDEARDARVLRARRWTRRGCTAISRSASPRGRVVWDANVRGIAACANAVSIASCSTANRWRSRTRRVSRRAGRCGAPARPGGVAVDRGLQQWRDARALPARVDAGARRRAARPVRRRAAGDARRLAQAGTERQDPPRRLGRTGLGEALKSRVEWTLRQKIDALAPTRIVVPSGLERRIDYASTQRRRWKAAGAPVLAVKLQELFGLADTPRIAEGRVPLTLHLLSPGGKPLQITRTCAASGTAPIRGEEGNEGPLSAASVAG
jgi:ATP-dependent helicase HrpB